MVSNKKIRPSLVKNILKCYYFPVMLSEQEETINKYKTRLRELGENIASDVEDEENDDDLT